MIPVDHQLEVDAGGGWAETALAGSVGWVALAAGGFAWELIARVADVVFLPPLSRVLWATWEMIAGGQILGALATSLASLVLGFCAAVLCGVIVGTAMGRYRTLEHLLDVYLFTLLAAPGLIFVPVLFALFGVSRLSQTAVVFLYAVFVIAANSLAGVKSVDREVMEMGRAFGASERQLFWRIILPGAWPLVRAGLRIGLARAVKGMVNGEMFIALMGLGALIKLYGSRFEADRVLGVLLVIMAVALTTTHAFQVFERRLTRAPD